MPTNPLPPPLAARPGPRPLPFHLVTQATSLLSSHLALPHWKNGWPVSRENCTTSESELRAIIAGQDSEKFRRALTEESVKRVAAFIKGVELYRRHPYRRALPPPPVVWQRGNVRLLDYGTPGSQGAPLLVVPSLINRAYILDLTERRSLMRWLRARGFRPFLVDWGAPGPAESAYGLEDYIALLLVEALDRVIALAGRPVLLGYCMGGLMALGLAALRETDLKGLILLATPWDFHQPPGAIAPRRQEWLETLLQDFRQLPADLLQIMFALQDPLAVERKFRQFGRLRPGSAAAQNFVALEDWVNDCVPLTAKVADETLGGWYGDNLPGRGTWSIAGQTIDPARIGLPTLIMVPARDRIVPAPQALALLERMKQARLEWGEGGHVGMIIGPRAATSVYQPIGRAVRRMTSST